VDILCISTTDWDEIWGSRQQIMNQLAAKGNRILFIERQVSIEHLLRDPLLRKRKMAAWKHSSLRQLSNNIWLLNPRLMVPGRYYSLQLNRIGQTRLAGFIRPVLRSLDMSRPLLWLYPPHSAPLLGSFHETLSLYHCIDRFTGLQTGLKKKVMESQEHQLLQNVDLVFTHSEGLQKRYAAYTKQPITLVPSAADVAHFQSTSRVHPDIAILPTPRLGVMGTLDGRIDVELLVSLAKQRPDWHLVLVGQVRQGRIDLNLLFDLPNVHYLGLRPFDELPSLLNGMDILLIPYVLDGLTKYISPIKLYEYLAIGKPIVSVPLSEVYQLAEYVEIAAPQEFLNTIQHLLARDNSPAQQLRRQAAQKHTWEIRANLMLDRVVKQLAEIEQ